MNSHSIIMRARNSEFFVQLLTVYRMTKHPSIFRGVLKMVMASDWITDQRWESKELLAGSIALVRDRFLAGWFPLSSLGHWANSAKKE